MTFVGISLTIESRPAPKTVLKFLVPILGVLAALLAGAALLLLDGEFPSPLTVYREGLDGAFGDSFAIGETLSQAVPLMLTGAAAAIAFRASLYNIGGEGQLYLGAIAAGAVGLTLGDDLPTIVVIPLILLAGALGGALWALLAAIPRARWGTNEILPTLMLNFVALNLMNYFVFGTTSIFRDSVQSTFPSGRDLPADARLPGLSGRLDVSILIAMIVVLGVGAWLAWSRWGVGLRIAGDSASTARYSGVNLKYMIVAVMCISGALAGLGGALLVSGRVGALEPRTLAVDLGYIGIVVAALSRLNFFFLIPVAVLIGSLDTAAPAMQRVGVPEAIVLAIEAFILFFVIVGDYWLHHRVRLRRASRNPDVPVLTEDVPLDHDARATELQNAGHLPLASQETDS